MVGTLSRAPIQFTLFALLLALFTGCHQQAGERRPKAESAPIGAAAQGAATQGALDIEESTPSDYRLNLPPHFGRWTGDWDEIRKHNVLRMLVVYSKTFYFLDKARQHGVTYAAGIELEKDVPIVGVRMMSIAPRDVCSGGDPCRKPSGWRACVSGSTRFTDRSVAQLPVEPAGS